MYKLKIGSLDIPTLYICDSAKDARECKRLGVPYLKKNKDMTDEDIVKFALLETLKSKFPSIKWNEVLGINYDDAKEFIVHVPGGSGWRCKSIGTGDDDGDVSVMVADDVREFSDGFEPGEVDYCERTLGSHIGNFAAEVKIEELQALNLLPVFLDDVTEAIRRNLYGLNWSEGFNKKLGVPVGNFDAATQATNLMILDVSGSIPRGVSSTMLTLIDTLRIQADADLIITGSVSMLWKAGDELPTPQYIRDRIGYDNEAKQFYQILKDNYAGKKIGNLICFGDNDAPKFFAKEDESLSREEFEGTEVEMIWSFHTWKKTTPGYALWAKDLCGCESEKINTDWCQFMDNRY